MSPQAFIRKERNRQIRETFEIAVGVFFFGVLVGAMVVFAEAIKMAVRL